MPGKKWTWNDAEDAFLRRMYDSAIRGRSQEIANRLRRSQPRIHHLKHHHK